MVKEKEISPFIAFIGPIAGCFGVFSNIHNWKDRCKGLPGCTRSLMSKFKVSMLVWQLASEKENKNKLDMALLSISPRLNCSSFPKRCSIHQVYQIWTQCGSA